MYSSFDRRISKFYFVIFDFKYFILILVRRENILSYLDARYTLYNRNLRHNRTEYENIFWNKYFHVAETEIG